jgi:hypothetical protein
VSGAPVIVTVDMALRQHQRAPRADGDAVADALQERGAGCPAEQVDLGRIPGSLDDTSEHLA